MRKAKWLIAIGFFAGVLIAAKPITSLTSELSGQGGTLPPVTTPAPTTAPTPVATTTPHPTYTYTMPPTTGSGTTTGSGSTTGFGTTGGDTTGTPPPTAQTTPVAPTPTPIPVVTAPSGPPTVLFADDFQSATVGQTSDLGSGIVGQEGTNKYVALGEARLTIAHPGWIVTSISASVMESGGMAAVGASNGSVSYFCGIADGQLTLQGQSGSQSASMGTAPYSVDVNTSWVGIRLDAANGKLHCATSDGTAVVNASIPSTFRANAAILQSRVRAATQTDDFTLLSVSGYEVLPT